MKNYGKYKILGESRDDAAGEAFDKAARILGLGYPGGPAIAAEAAKFPISKSPARNVTHPPAALQQLRAGSVAGGQSPNKLQIQNYKSKTKEQITLPRPMINSTDYEFSFSGLKTALLYKVQKDPLYPAKNEAGESWKKRVPEYCAEFQQAIIDVLITKALKAAAEYKVKTIMLSGGVSANKELRRQMDEAIKKRLPKTKFLVPRPEFTTDNAAMIAAAGYFQAKSRAFDKPEKVIANPGLRL
jgi:N6-L-threonylcarbamoyladenine synthase